MSETNKALVRRYYNEVITQRNTAVLDDLLAPEFVSYLSPGVSVSREQYLQAIAMSHAAFPDLRVTVQDQIAEGDKVVTRWSAQGIQSGAFAGISSTGKQVTVTAIHIHRVENGLLVEHGEEINLFGVMQQLGVL